MQGQESRLGFSGLILSLLPLSSSPQPTLAPGILTSTFAPPPPPPQFPGRKGSYHPVSQLGRKKAGCLEAGGWPG